MLTKKERVEMLLENAGYNPSCLSAATGYWKQADVYRWEVILTINGLKRCCGSWQTMTTFLKYAEKYGFTLQDDELWANDI